MLCQACSFGLSKLENDGEQLIRQMWKKVEVLYKQLSFHLFDQ
jgi:hypothetical protein